MKEEDRPPPLREAAARARCFFSLAFFAFALQQHNHPNKESVSLKRYRVRIVLHVHPGSMCCVSLSLCVRGFFVRVSWSSLSGGGARAMAGREKRRAPWRWKTREYGPGKMHVSVCRCHRVAGGKKEEGHQRSAASARDRWLVRRRRVPPLQQRQLLRIRRRPHALAVSVRGRSLTLQDVACEAARPILLVPSHHHSSRR